MTRVNTRSSQVRIRAQTEYVFEELDKLKYQKRLRRSSKIQA